MQVRLDVDGGTGSIAAAYANNPMQVCRCRLHCICLLLMQFALLTLALSTVFVPALRNQSCQCGIVLRTPRQSILIAAGLVLQGLPSPLIIRPLAKAEYFEVTLPACINIYQLYNANTCIMFPQKALTVVILLQKRPPFNLASIIMSPYGLMIGEPAPCLLCHSSHHCIAKRYVACIYTAKGAAV